MAPEEALGEILQVYIFVPIFSYSYFFFPVVDDLGRISMSYIHSFLW